VDTGLGPSSTPQLFACHGKQVVNKSRISGCLRSLMKGYQAAVFVYFSAEYR
jgi:hypothetical protein